MLVADENWIAAVEMAITAVEGVAVVDDVGDLVVGGKVLSFSPMTMVIPGIQLPSDCC